MNGASLPSRAPGDLAVTQLSARGIFLVWAAAAIPMGLLAWLAAPLLAGHLNGPARLGQALAIALTAGLIWQFALVLILISRETPLSWPAVRAALWLGPPRSRRGGPPTGRAWLAVLPPTIAFALVQIIPSPPHPAARDLGKFLSSHAGRVVLAGSWGWFGLLAVLFVFNTVLGEELLFRGYLLPRMTRAFGRKDWLANGFLFGAYHLHMPWAIPSSMLNGMLFAFPSKRQRSALMGIVVHSMQSIVFLGLTLTLVLKT